MNDRGATGSAPTDRPRALSFGPDPRWTALPAARTWTEVAAVATDSQDRVFVFNRGPRPLQVFEPDGTSIGDWGPERFARPHGLFIGRDESVYCTDDLDHTVQKFTRDGTLVLTLGTSGRPSDTGATSIDYRTIVRPGPPFHYPTNVAVAGDGSLFVADGYGNARVHKFSPDGRLLLSWGEPGTGPGQFRVPHGIAVDGRGTVYVADRENSRLQLFSSGGEFIGQWTDVARPCQVYIDGGDDVYVAELGFRAGMWPGTSAASDAPGGRVSVFDREGRLLARWGGGGDPCSSGDFFAPHGIWVDSQGSVYVAEVVWSAGAKRGLVPADCHALQKFVRRPRT